MIARFGDCEVDLDRLEVRSAGDIVAVEPQVFDVLSYLLEHRDRTVTKEELLDNIWGDRFVTESALTSRIKSARRALGDNGRDQAVIRTAHGRGYQFVAEVTMVEETDRTRSAAPGAEVTLPPADAPALDGAWPLVGRHDEIEQLDQLLHDPDRNGVLLTGPASVGKTRLARAVVDRARAAGFPTAMVSGHAQAESVPLAALAHLLPDEILNAGTAPGEIARTIVFQRARTVLSDLGGEQRFVMLVDNADQIDELSSALLGSLISSGSIFVVLTQRTGPGTALVFDELVRSTQLAHVDLGSLDDTDLDVLLYRVLAGPIDLDSLQQLTTLSRGRPGVLRQLVQTCLANQTLSKEAGVWRLVGPIQPAVGVPGSDQLLLTSLEPAAATGAELLAVARELDLDVATRLIGADVLDDLDRAGLLMVAESPGDLRVSIAHPHLSMLLEERLGPLRARRHKTRLIDAIDVERATDHDRMRRVRWMLETGRVPDLDEAKRATRFAVATGNGVAADIMLEHLDSTDAANEADQLRAELHFRRGQIDRADELLERVDISTLEPITAATVVRRRATIRFHARGQFEDALSILADAEQEFDGAARDLVTAHWIGFHGFLGSTDAVLERAEQLPDDLGRAPRLETLRGTAQAHLAGGSCALAIETLDRHDAESVGLAAGAAQAGREVALACRIAAHTAAGELRTATDLVRRHLPIGRRTMLAWLPMAAARAELMAGHSRAAEDLISTPLAAVRSQNLIHAEPQMVGIMAQATVRNGDIESARSLISDCWGALDTLVGQLEWSLLVSVADVSTHIGVRPELVERLIGAADAAHDAGASLLEAELLMAAARVGAADVVADRLVAVASTIDGALWTVRAQHATALATGDVDALAAIGETYRTLGYDGYADGVAHALANPVG